MPISLASSVMTGKWYHWAMGRKDTVSGDSCRDKACAG